MLITERWALGYCTHHAALHTAWSRLLALLLGRRAPCDRLVGFHPEKRSYELNAFSAITTPFTLEVISMDERHIKVEQGEGTAMLCCLQTSGPSEDVLWSSFTLSLERI